MKMTLGRMKKAMFKTRILQVTHCLEASERHWSSACTQLCSHCYVSSKIAWLVPSFSMPGPPYQRESEVFLCFQGMETGLYQDAMTLREKEKCSSSLKMPGIEMWQEKALYISPTLFSWTHESMNFLALIFIDVVSHQVLVSLTAHILPFSFILLRSHAAELQ